MINFLKRHLHKFLTSDKPVSIAPYRFGRKTALAITFDDGSQDHFDIATPLLNEFGFKGTFFALPGLTREKRGDALISGSALERWGGVCWDEWREMHRMGHEIANHSWSHQKLPALQASELEADIARSYDVISEKIGAPPVSFAYPWNNSNEHVKSAAHKKHRFTRDAQQLAFGAANTSIESFTKAIDLGIRNRQKIIAMVHGIDIGTLNPKRTYTVTKDFFLEFLKELKKRENDIWVDTFGNLGRYELYTKYGRVKVKNASENGLKFVVSGLNGIQDLNVSFGPTVRIRYNLGKKLVRADAFTPSGRIDLLPNLRSGDEEIYLDLPVDCDGGELEWKS